MASEVAYARGAGAGERNLTGGMSNEPRELSEEEIKELAREYNASWQMPPSGLYIFDVWRVSKRITAESKTGKEYTYRQVLGYAHGQSGNLTYNGVVLLKVIGTQAEIIAKIAKGENRKCLMDIRKWNGMNRINSIYSFEYIERLLMDNPGDTRRELEMINNGK